MRSLTAAACLVAALGAAGCTGRLMWVPYESCTSMPPESSVERSVAAQVGVPCPPKCEEPLPRRTVFVRGPQQKIVIERECPPKKEGPAKSAARAPDKQPETVPAVANDVILVPRTVYVPYAAQTPTRAARLAAPFVPEAMPGPSGAPVEPPPPSKTVDTKPPVTTVAPCPTECAPTTVIEIRQMNERIDRLHRILERLCAPGERHRE